MRYLTPGRLEMIRTFQQGATYVSRSGFLHDIYSEQIEPLSWTHEPRIARGKSSISRSAGALTSYPVTSCPHNSSMGPRSGRCPVPIELAVEIANRFPGPLNTLARTGDVPLLLLSVRARKRLVDGISKW